MGCGGSKEEVATGNTLSLKSLQKKNSDASKTTPNANLTPENNVEKVEENRTLVASDDAKEDPPISAEGGKLITKESPDRYFSSRKDEEVVKGVTTALGYEVGKVKAENAAVGVVEVDGKLEAEVVEEKSGLVGEGGQEIVPAIQGDGKHSVQDSADFKDAILVEEVDSENVPVEKKNVGEGETDTLVQ